MKTTDNLAKRILVVEDEIPIGNMCRRVLSGEGFEVDVAINGKVAQDMIKRKQYDLYLIDIKMPEMDGRQLYQWMKQERLELANAVIFATGSVLGDDTAAFIEEASKPFLPKPFSSNQLITTVKEALKALGG